MCAGLNQSHLIKSQLNSYIAPSIGASGLTDVKADGTGILVPDKRWPEDSWFADHSFHYDPAVAATPAKSVASTRTTGIMSVVAIAPLRNGTQKAASQFTFRFLAYAIGTYMS